MELAGQILLTQDELDACVDDLSGWGVSTNDIKSMVKRMVSQVNQLRLGDPEGTLRRNSVTGEIAERIPYRDSFGIRLAWRIIKNGNVNRREFDKNIDLEMWPEIHHGTSWFSVAVKEQEPTK